MTININDMNTNYNQKITSNKQFKHIFSNFIFMLRRIKHQLDPPLINESAMELLASYFNWEISNGYKTLIPFIDSIESSCFMSR